MNTRIVQGPNGKLHLSREPGHLQCNNNAGHQYVPVAIEVARRAVNDRLCWKCFDGSAARTDEKIDRAIAEGKLQDPADPKYRVKDKRQFVRDGRRLTAFRLYRIGEPIADSIPAYRDSWVGKAFLDLIPAGIYEVDGWDLSDKQIINLTGEDLNHG